jgi:CubicO group peptidase (beta-lactamase class C family)
MRNKLFAFSFLLLMAEQTAFTQKPINKGSLAATSTSALTKKLDSVFSSFNKSTPGIAVTVFQNEKVLAKKAYGLESLEFSVAFTYNTIVRIAYSEGRVISLACRDTNHATNNVL